MKLLKLENVAVAVKMFGRLRLYHVLQPAGEIFSVWRCWWWSVRCLHCPPQQCCELAGAAPGTPAEPPPLPLWPSTPCSRSSNQTSPSSPPPPWGPPCTYRVRVEDCLTLLCYYLSSSVRSTLLPTTTMGTLKYQSSLCNSPVLSNQIDSPFAEFTLLANHFSKSWQR